MVTPLRIAARWFLCWRVGSLAVSLLTASACVLFSGPESVLTASMISLFTVSLGVLFGNTGPAFQAVSLLTASIVSLFTVSLGVLFGPAFQAVSLLIASAYVLFSGSESVLTASMVSLFPC